MHSNRLCLVAVAALLCLSSTCLAQELKQYYDKYKEVPGIRKREDGVRYIEVGDGESTSRYLVAKDEATKQIYFINAANNEAQWNDPRAPAPVETAEAEPTVVNIPMEPPKPKSSSITVAIVAMLPILLFAGGTAARVAYLQMYYPELLWPTKERKDRRKAPGGKIKPQKARGRLNQDGKGGSSAS